MRKMNILSLVDEESKFPRVSRIETTHAFATVRNVLQTNSWLFLVEVSIDISGGGTSSCWYTSSLLPYEQVPAALVVVEETAALLASFWHRMHIIHVVKN